MQQLSSEISLMQYPEIKNILIDLDGTLTDPKVGITTSARYGLAKAGLQLSEHENIDWIIGPPLKQSLAQILQVDVDDCLAEQALLGYRERFADIGLYENMVYPTVDHTLKTLQQRGYRLFVATAKPTIYAKKILQHFQLAQYFEQIYGSELTGERCDKAELIAYILKQSQLDASQCIMLGDREYDILGARANHIPAIAVNYGYGSPKEIQQAAPTQVISSFATLLEIFH